MRVRPGEVVARLGHHPVLLLLPQLLVPGLDTRASQRTPAPHLLVLLPVDKILARFVVGREARGADGLAGVVVAGAGLLNAVVVVAACCAVLCEVAVGRGRAVCAGYIGLAA